MNSQQLNSLPQALPQYFALKCNKKGVCNVVLVNEAPYSFEYSLTEFQPRKDLYLLRINTKPIGYENSAYKVKDDGLAYIKNGIRIFSVSGPANYRPPFIKIINEQDPAELLPVETYQSYLARQKSPHYNFAYESRPLPKLATTHKPQFYEDAIDKSNSYVEVIASAKRQREGDISNHGIEKTYINASSNDRLDTNPSTKRQRVEKSISDHNEQCIFSPLPILSDKEQSLAENLQNSTVNGSSAVANSSSPLFQSGLTFFNSSFKQCSSEEYVGEWDFLFEP